jgi:hypothetical protein
MAMSLGTQPGAIAAIAAISGSVVGAMASLATTFINQRFQARRERLNKELANREELYASFIEEAIPLFVASINTMEIDPSTMLKLYSVVGRIRLIASDEVLRGAEKVVADLIESYRRPITDVSEVIYNVGHNALDPMREFTQACRRERHGILGQM